MSNNEQVMLETILDQKRNELDSSLSKNSFFEIFAAEQILKNFELSYDEIIEGIVDNGGDGAIDAIYTFVNSELIQRDSELINAKRNAIIDVYIIQAKNRLRHFNDMSFFPTTAYCPNYSRSLYGHQYAKRRPGRKDEGSRFYSRISFLVFE